MSDVAERTRLLVPGPVSRRSVPAMLTEVRGWRQCG